MCSLRSLSIILNVKSKNFLVCESASLRSLNYVVGMSYVCHMSNLLRRRNYVRPPPAHAQSLFLAVKPVTPVLFISYTLDWTKKKLKKAFT